MSRERLFPIMGEGVSSAKVCLVPWQFMAPHEEWAKRNHDQTLERLAERGGLDPAEAVAVIGGHEYGSISRDEALAILYRKLADFYLTRARSAGSSTGGGR